MEASTMTDFDLDDDLDDTGQDDFGQRENHNLAQLRKRAKDAARVEKENATLKAELDTLKRTSAFKDAGIDLTSPLGKLFAEAYRDEPDADKVKARALEYGVIQPSTEQVEQQEREQSLQRLAHTTGQANTGAPAPTLDADTYASWAPEVRRSFLRDHPREAQALKRGETIPAVSGY